MIVNDPGDRTEIVIQQVNDRAGGELFADARELLDVGEKDREAAPLGLIGAAANQTANDARIDELSERVLDVLSCAQFANHSVKGMRQFADLVPGANQHWHNIRTRFDVFCAGNKLAQAGHHTRGTDRADSETYPACREEQCEA